MAQYMPVQHARRLPPSDTNTPHNTPHTTRHTWQHAQPAAEHIAPQIHTGEAVEVVGHSQGQQGAQAQQRHELEPVAADGAVDCCKALVLVRKLGDLQAGGSAR